MLSEGAERMVEMTGWMLVELLRHGGARIVQDMVSVGEASNPGPRLRRYRRGMTPTRAAEEPLVPHQPIVFKDVPESVFGTGRSRQVPTRPPSVCSTVRTSHSRLIRSLSGHVWTPRLARSRKR